MVRRNWPTCSTARTENLGSWTEGQNLVLEPPETTLDPNSTGHSISTMNEWEAVQQKVSFTEKRKVMKVLD